MGSVSLRKVFGSLPPERGSAHVSQMKDVFRLELNHWHLDQSPQGSTLLVGRFPGSPVWLRRILTIGVLYLWLTTSLISGTKTGQARDKTESSKLRATGSYSPGGSARCQAPLPSVSSHSGCGGLGYDRTEFSLSSQTP